MKYKLTNNKKDVCGRTLYQIEALKDFGNIKKGDLGGWIEREDNLSQDDNCWVSGNAWVSGDARVYENAQVFENAWVLDNARVSGDAEVSGNARVSGDAQVSGNARLSANLHYKTGTDYWKAQYVLGDYEIEEQDDNVALEAIKLLEEKGYKIIKK